MRAGGIDRRVTLEERTQVREKSGQLKDEWAPLGAFWMGKRDRRANERFVDNQLAAEVDTVFKARFQPLFLSVFPDTHRLIYRDQVFEIKGKAELGRRDAVEFYCVARAERRLST